MKKICVFIVSIFLIGCITEKKRFEICQSCPEKTVSKDSINQQTIIKDSVIYVQLPQDTIKITDSLPCDKLINIHPKTINAGSIKAKAWVKNNILFLEAYTTDKQIPVIVERVKAQQIKYIYRDIIKTLPAKIIYKIPWYIYLTISLLVGFILYLFAKKFISKYHSIY